MTQSTFDHAPGDIPVAEEGASSGLLVYTIGLLLAIALNRPIRFVGFYRTCIFVPFVASAAATGKIGRAHV